MTTELAVRESHLPDLAVMRRELEMVKQVQAVVKELLVDGVDYGIIPGTGNKPALLKPGAEKLRLAFRFIDDYEIIDDPQVAWPHKGHTAICKVTDMDGNRVATGVGYCTTLESKYKWRNVHENDIEHLGLIREELKASRRKSRNGGYYTQYQRENPDIADEYNTCVKMAKKRSLVDAMLSIGALSELFTQDVEDTRGNRDEVPAREREPEDGPPVERNRHRNAGRQPEHGRDDLFRHTHAKPNMDRMAQALKDGDLEAAKYYLDWAKDSQNSNHPNVQDSLARAEDAYNFAVSEASEKQSPETVEGEYSEVEYKPGPSTEPPPPLPTDSKGNTMAKDEREAKARREAMEADWVTCANPDCGDRIPPSNVDGQGRCILCLDVELPESPADEPADTPEEPTDPLEALGEWVEANGGAMADVGDVLKMPWDEWLKLMGDPAMALERAKARIAEEWGFGID